MQNLERPDVGLSHAGSGLDDPQQIPDLGHSLVRDSGARVDTGLADHDAGAPNDAGRVVADAASGDLGAQPADAAGLDGGETSGDAALGVDAAPVDLDVGQRVDGGVEADAGAPGDAGFTHAQITGTVFDILTRRGLIGVEVCVRNQQPQYPCATTAGGGQFTMRAPANADVELVYTGGNPAILPTIVHLRLPLGPSTWNVGVLAATMVPQLATMLGQQLDPTKGHVSFTVGTAGNVGLAGVTGAIAPVSGAGPFYLAANGFPDRNATRTSSNGTGALINVNPGTINVSITPPNTHDCLPYSIAVRQGNAWRVPVVAGHLSIAVFECTAR